MNKSGFLQRQKQQQQLYMDITERIMKQFKVLGKLAQYRGDNIRALATVHLPKALATSEMKHPPMSIVISGWMKKDGYIEPHTYRTERETFTKLR